MSLKINSVKETEKDIKFMTNLDVDFVSFVPHGANKEPFRVFKTAKGGVMNNVAVQSLILSDNADLASLSAKSNLGWLSEITTDTVVKNDAYSKIVQVDLEQFDKDSLQLLKLDDSGAWAIVGALKQNATPGEKAVTISEKQVKDLKEQSKKSFFQQPVTDPELTQNWYVPSVTAGDLFIEELWNMEDVLFSILRQEGLDSKKRKRAILDSIDAFKGFLSMLLDSVGESDIKINKTKRDTKEGENMELFKTQKEFDEAVDQRVQAALEAQKKAADSTTEPAPDTKTQDDKGTKTDTGASTEPEAQTGQKGAQPTGTTEEPSGTQTADATKTADASEVPDWAKSLSEDIKAFKESVAARIEKLENSPGSEPANGTDTDTGGTTADTKSSKREVDVEFDDNVINPKYRGTFSGLFGSLS